MSILQLFICRPQRAHHFRRLVRAFRPVPVFAEQIRQLAMVPMGFIGIGRVISRNEIFPYDSTSEGFMVVFIGRSTPEKVSSLEITLLVLVNLFSKTFLWWYVIVHRGYVEEVENVFKIYGEVRDKMGKVSLSLIKNKDPERISIFQDARPNENMNKCFFWSLW